MNLKRLRKKARSSKATPSDPMNVGASMVTPFSPALHLLHGQVDRARVRRVGPGLALFIGQGMALQREEGCREGLGARFVENEQGFSHGFLHDVVFSRTNLQGTGWRVNSGKRNRRCQLRLG